MPQDSIPDTAGSRMLRKRGFVLLLLLCSAVVIFFVVLMQKRSPVVAVPQAIPLPFGSTDSSVLKSLLTNLGTTTDNRKIVDMSFEDKDSELFGVNDLTFVLTPEVAETFSDGVPLSVALTAGKRLYGYRYKSKNASEEIAMQALKNDPDNSTEYEYSQLFPGTFFASAASLADKAFVDGFAAKGINCLPLEDVTLDANARYLIIAEEAEVSMTVRDLKWCGDAQIQSPEACDDSNRTNDDGCSSCQIDTRYTCTGAPSLCIRALCNPPEFFALSDPHPVQQTYGRLALAENGNGVAVWNDFSARVVRMRRFVDGSPVGGEASLGDGGSIYDVATEDTGRFVIVEERMPNQVGPIEVRVQFFASDGRVMSFGLLPKNEAFIYPYTFNEQIKPRIAMAPSGATVVVWQDVMTNSNRSLSLSNVFAQRFDTLGKAIGSKIVVAAAAAAPDVSVSRNGEFVVTWHTYTSTPYIRARAFNADGTPQGSEIDISGLYGGSRVPPAIATDGDGQFAVLWQEGSTTGGRQMTVRFLTLHPMAIGVPIVVGTMDGDLADRPHLAITRGQRAVLGWFDQQQRVKYVDFIGSTATVHDVPFSGLPHLDNILVGSDRTILAVGASTGPGTMTLVTYRQCGDPYPVETCTPANVTSGTVCSTEAP